LDYGAEEKSEEEDFEEALEQLLNAIDFAASNNSVPVVSCKLTALVANDILINKQLGKAFSSHEQECYAKFYDRIDTVCSRAAELNVGVFIDAEESWMQVAMDEVVEQLMAAYNQQRIIVYNTYQMYRHDKLAQLKRDYEIAKQKGYILGAKLVRGAYMEKERDRAKAKGYPSPIHANKEAVDKDYNEGLLFCLDHYKEIAFCCASHNLESNMLLATEISVRDIPRDHKHVNFCQLQGMSDYITFNLSQAGYNTAKYVVYGPVKEVIDYLIRRAEENTSITGEMSRELSLISKEMERRSLK
jgi:proline dehydrogenase